MTSKAIARPQFKVNTQAKKDAISAVVKSSAASSAFVSKATITLKKPLTKSSSAGANISTAKSTVTKVPAAKSTVTAPVKNIARKIPPYDFKARFHDLKERYDTLKSKSDQQREQITSLEEQTEGFAEREKELLEKIEKIDQELSDVTEAKTKLENELQTIRSSYENEIQTLQAANSNLTMKNNALSLDLSEKCEILNSTKKSLSELTSKHEKQTIEFEELQAISGTLKRDFEEASTKLSLSQDQLYLINIERKVLHNMVLDLRGNIRVFARVRPPLSSEGDKMLCGWSFTDDCSLDIISNEIVQSTGTRKQTKHDFSFDQVFDPNTLQEDIFEMVSPLIQSALDGYNICIFAYGQTGSGKTFTMDGHDEKLGIIPRTVKLLFDSTKNAEILGWKYTIKASFLEIYNEVLYDLLSNDNKDIEIRMANAKNKTEIYVSNLTEIEVTTSARLHELMAIARSNRATASTAGNERSSRSHAVTRLEITGQHASKPEVLVGMINLVDLAGSESPKTSTRMDETKNINRSLSELSNVILALVQRNEHVPYRNSKLTHLLMPSLGGNSKTLMFVNVAPFQDCFVESVKSLRFAAQVNSCKLAKAKRNRQLNSSSVF
jgi:kinesin family protein C1